MLQIIFQIVLAVILSLASGWQYIGNVNRTNEELEAGKVSAKEATIFCGVLVILTVILTLVARFAPIIAMIISGVIIVGLGIFEFCQNESRQLRAIFGLSIPFIWVFWVATAKHVDLLENFSGGITSLILTLLIPICFVLICGIIRWIILKIAGSKKIEKLEDSDSLEEDEAEEKDLGNVDFEDESETETPNNFNNDEVDSSSLAPATIVTGVVALAAIIAVIIILV